MENQVVYMDKITSHPHAGCRIEKMAALDEALADRIPPDLLVKPRKVIFSCRFHFLISIAVKSCAV
jgi:hypothetical protein